MFRIGITGLVFALLLVWACTASAEMKEGLWEMTMQADMKGAPQQMPAVTMKQCLTKNDMVPKHQNKQPGQDCKMKDQKIVGDTVTYSMVCQNKDGGSMETAGKMTYKGNSFDGSSTTTIKPKGQGQNMQMSTRMSGKYLGPCTK